MSQTKIILMAAALFGLLAVAFGAFGSHFLEGRLDERATEIWDLAVEYQMYHGLMLFALAGLMVNYGGNWFRYAAWSTVAGTVIFSGSLYLLALTGIRWLGAITPIGGIALITGWLLTLIGVVNL